MAQEDSDYRNFLVRFSETGMFHNFIKKFVEKTVTRTSKKFFDNVRKYFYFICILFKALFEERLAEYKRDKGLSLKRKYL
jgi:hypothetical protein